MSPPSIPGARTADPPAPVPKSVSLLRFGLYGVVIVVGGAQFVVRLFQNHRPGGQGWALAAASVALLAVLFALDLAQFGRRLKKWGWTSVSLGADGRVSTSKTAMWLWTLGLAFAILYLTGVAIFVKPKDSDLFGGGTWDQYLLLVGGPFAAGVLAKYLVVSKATSGDVKTVVTGTADPTAAGVQAAMTSQKAASGGGAASAQGSTGLSDVLANDDGGLDLVDAQYFVFNLVAFVYASGVFAAHQLDSSVAAGKYALPVIPGVLLALTSASAATYVGNKAIQTSGPRISLVTAVKTAPSTFEVTVIGANLVPADVQPAIAKAQTAVWLSPKDGPDQPISVSPTTATPTRVVFTWPVAFKSAKVADVFVLRLDGSSSTPYPYDNPLSPP